MLFVTNEYSVLRGNKCKDVTLLPNQPFGAFEGNYVVTAYARILDEDGKDVVKLQAGEHIKGIGKVKRTRKKKEAKDGNGL